MAWLRVNLCNHLYWDDDHTLLTLIDATPEQRAAFEAAVVG